MSQKSLSETRSELAETQQTLVEARQQHQEQSQRDAAALEIEHQAKEAALLLGDSLASDLQIERERLQASQSANQKLEQDLRDLHQQLEDKSSEIEGLKLEHQDAISQLGRKHEAALQQHQDLAQEEKDQLKQHHLEAKAVCQHLFVALNNFAGSEVSFLRYLFLFFSEARAADSIS
jgi:hypothetical protein